MGTTWKWPECGDVDAELRVQFTGASKRGGYGRVCFGSCIDPERPWKEIVDYRDLPTAIPFPVAVKFWDPTHPTDIPPFILEMTRGSSLRHRNLVTTLRTFPANGHGRPPCIVMLRYDLTLRQALDAFTHQCRTLPWDKYNVIVQGICDGLRFLHTQQKPPLVHNDIKPSNVLIEFTDFGPLLADTPTDKEVCRAIVNRRFNVVIADLGVAQREQEVAYVFDGKDPFKHWQQKRSGNEANTGFDAYATVRVLSELRRIL